MESVKGKVVLITGSSAGIGAATAVLFAKYGSRLILTGRNKTNLDKTAEECFSKGLKKEDVLIVAADLTNDEDVKRIVDTAISTFGKIDILVNNAAATFAASLLSTSMDNFDNVYRLNLRAAVYLAKLVAPYLKENKGTIVNVSSVCATRPAVKIACYSVMKAALSMVTKDLALELAPDGVRVNEICPGHIDTSIHEQYIEGLQQFLSDLGSVYPIGRVGQPEEVAKAIVFLASDASSFTTGASMYVDGGLLQTASWDLLLNKE